MSTYFMAGPIDSDSDHDDLDMTTLVLDDPKGDRNEKYRYILISDRNYSWTFYDSRESVYSSDPDTHLHHQSKSVSA